MLELRLCALALAAGLLASACTRDEGSSCAALTIEVQLSAPIGADVRSFLVRTDGALGPRRAVVDAELAAGQSAVRLEAPGLAGGTDEVTVTGYAEAQIRGRLLVEGQVALADPGTCLAEVTVAPPTAIDAGFPPSDAGFADDASTERPDAGDVDVDAGHPEDGGPADSGVGPTCPFGPDPEALAYFGVDGDVGSSTLTDSAGQWQATLRPRGATISAADGPPGCGDALALSGQAWAVIDDSGALEPPQGALDFWVRFEGEPTARQGIISRDASGQAQAGHLSVFRTCDDHVVVRIQDQSNSYYRCSDVTLEPGRWAHVGINFGAPGVELWVNGEISTGTIAVGLWGDGCTALIPCDQRPDLDIVGNRNPWVLGADASGSEEGGAEPAYNVLRGALDGVRISARRRRFTP
ncbi:MAG: hypothetical protein KC933_16945 [Myxococcales bacterium]|nr:hypothetical protein [Myxococcales bacterium]